MTVKKTWAAILAFTMICGAATGCTNSNGSSTSDSESAAANAGTSTTDTITLVWYPNESAEDYQAARDEVGKLIEKATGKKVEQKLKLTTPSQSSLFPTAQHRSDAAWVQKDTARRKPQTMP